MTKVIKAPKEMFLVHKECKSLGFVPTMGALHRGHGELIKKSMSENEKTTVSIFVNQTQFNDPTDYEKYPRPLQKDLDYLNHLGVDVCFLPEFSDLYPDDYRFKISETKDSQILCGAFRPGHFTGMLSVVAKLLAIVRPTRAYFGEKDYQQLQLVSDMVDSLFLDTEIVPVPTVRETDGLALSSRNVRLSDEERKKAVEFPKVLSQWTLSDKQVREKLEAEGFKVDYVETHWGRRLGAVHLGKVRLIDNFPIPEKDLGL